ncbi:MAG: CHASE domain-containing protein [Candidatus Doudnabacteria bacterium]|nr:CHASE domain-containing protein [Candidatus Doudnabacteria bacterium]
MRESLTKKQISRAVFYFLAISSSVVILGIILIIAREVILSRARTNLKDTAETFTSLLTEKFEAYVSTLYAVRAVVAQDPEITLPEWVSLQDSIAVKDRYPGISGFSYIQKVNSADITGYVARVSGDAQTIGYDPEYKNFKITDQTNLPTSYIVRYVYPHNTWSRTIGLDLSSKPSRYQAMLIAGSSASPQSSDQLSLFNSGKAGFVIFLPIYIQGTDESSGAELSGNLVGFVSAVFESDTLFKKTFEALPESMQSMNIEVISYDSMGEEVAVYRNERTGRDDSVNMTMKIAGKEWMINFSADYLHRLPEWIPLAVGIPVVGVLSLNIFLFSLIGSLRRRAAPDLTENRTPAF